ncbi:hypothetical protein CQW49_23165 (plasmid) [Methylosinus trichosporium OB3b]|uniref:Uncharacterized protein n=1 Tax=Methylosinus trichosporium (strain ATCC 35070 / NCIMB 11131 / UNIQEM 75 / OB3b) TaxID=595536 RepID=A0A2D2D7E5_METT3|nr:tetratricopeptide repeat protein [Methylosinus trichosporium]ATQ70855.1 hypothetical protein CQW49_23165 [Methylosinus trichosporium OB3b]
MGGGPKPGFAMALDDSDLMNVVRSDASEELYMVFSHIGFPRGKFAQSTLLSGARVDRLYLNTMDNDWYQRDIDQTADRLAETISSLGPRRITCAGSSMGAYASMLFGCRLGAQRVIAVAPEIKIGEPWQRSFLLNRTRVYDPRYTNLHDTIASASGVEIYVAAYDLIDLGGFDERLLDYAGVSVKFLSGDHKVSERLDWRRLYAGDGDIGVHRLSELPCNMHDYTEAKRALHDGRIDDASKLLLSRCEWSDFAPDFFFAALYMPSTNIDAAIVLLQHALKLDSNSAQSLHQLGLCLAARGRRDEAVARFRDALAIHEAAPATHFRLAETLAVLGLKGAAGAHLARALSLDPNNPAYQALAGRLRDKSPAAVP